MEVEEDADTEREDLKAREARKKVLISLQILCIQICTYVLLSILAIADCATDIFKVYFLF